jgi:hypothetical protein
VLHYLKGTPSNGITYTRDQAQLNRVWSVQSKEIKGAEWKLNTLYAFSDSDFAGCIDTFRCTTGMVLMMNGGAIS